MLVHPNIDPIAFSLGPLSVRWYGLMYLAAFGMLWWLGMRRIAQGRAPVTREQMDAIVFYGVIGVVLGGRLGYVLFYQPGYYLSHPLEILMVWRGGMSFHGGFLGALFAAIYGARKFGADWLVLIDFLIPLGPPGLAAGRLGNFINGEHYGRVTDVPWGMVFRGAEAGPLPRHPSQLYEMMLEGLLLFAVLWWYSSKPRPRGSVFALFLVGYGIARFIAEFFREEEPDLRNLALGLTFGQWLTVPMLIAGGALYASSIRRR